VFEEFMGLPMHPLVVHAPVVVVPLLVLAGLVYAFVPQLRERIAWASVLLAVAAPVTALLARQSGEDLRDVLIRKNYPPEILNQVAEHQSYGDKTFWFSLGLGVTTSILVLVTGGNPRVRSLPAWVRPVLIAAVVVFAVLSIIYIYLTGESGAKAVWTGVL
jgi:uncharacterized membrane protein